MGKKGVENLPPFMVSKDFHCPYHYFFSWETLLTLNISEETMIELFEKQISSIQSKEIFNLSNISEDKMAEFNN